jgi:hypothetical protein
MLQIQGQLSLKPLGDYISQSLTLIHMRSQTERSLGVEVAVSYLNHNIGMARAAVDEAGMVFAVFFVNGPTPAGVVYLHISAHDALIPRFKTQYALFQEYVALLFSLGCSKIVAELPQHYRIRIKMVELQGFLLESVLTDEWLKDGQLVDTYRYGLLRKHYEPGRSRLQQG